MEIDIVSAVISVVSWYYDTFGPCERWLIRHTARALFSIARGLYRRRLGGPSSTGAGSVAGVGAGVVDQGGSPCCARCGDPLGDGGGVAAGDQVIGEAGVRVARGDLAGG